MAHSKLPDSSWWRLVLELDALRDDPPDVFAGISDEVLDRYLSGEGSEAERAQIDARKEREPWLLETIEAWQWALHPGRELPEPPAPWPSIFAGVPSAAEDAGKSLGKDR